MSHSLTFPEKTILVCDGSKCSKHKDVRRLLKDAVKENGLKDRVEVVKIDCTDRCKHAPIICFQPQNQWFGNVSIYQAKRLFDELVMERK